MLLVAEMFTSLQGETTFTGWPCAFLRLAGCNLRCRWCDTPYAREPGGEPWELERLVARVSAGPRLVTVTGGEPLCQEETPELVRRLLAAGHTVLVETNGSLPIARIDARAHRMVDLKPPSSGVVAAIHWPNLDRLTERDELKVVIADRADYEWARERMAEDPRIGRATVNLSPAFGILPARELAAWMLEDGLAARLNIQLHRVLWPEADRGR
jgi:7-carboxy-7-deazaguanine synthase